MKKTVMIILTILIMSGCGSDTPKNENNITGDVPIEAIPVISSEFDWRLDKIQSNNTRVTARTIDVDAVLTTKESVEKWQEEGRTVLAYISVGTYESLRPDAGDFNSSIIGHAYPGFKNEYFVDIRDIDILRPIIKKRFDKIKEKGFDGIEPDNMDSYIRDVYGDKNGTGFDLNEEDARKYVDFLIKEAHDRNLTIGQKNAYGLAEDYVDKFDWALTEGIFYEGNDDFKERMSIYVDNNKTVYATEYTDDMTKEYFLSDVCLEAKELGFVAILKDRNLTEYIENCPKD